MSSFVALNIEPNEDAEEVDDTKEIQIEEALKLYQTALRLHSQGPDHYHQAREAYEALFKSDIFNYPEAVSEYKRDQLLYIEHESFDYYEDIAEGDISDPINTTSSALPQTIFLSYRNHAQFILDDLQNSLRDANKHDYKRLSNRIKEALEGFAEALERDDTDMDLWRKSSRVGDALNSRRISRFCLESVLECDDYGIDERFGQLGLEQIFAVRDLRRILDALQDNLSSTNLPLKKPKNSISRLFEKQADMYPFLPTRSDGPSTLGPHQDATAPYHIVESAAKTWIDVGNAILKALVEVSETAYLTWPSASLRILNKHVITEQSPISPVVEGAPNNEVPDILPDATQDTEILDVESDGTLVGSDKSTLEAMETGGEVVTINVPGPPHIVENTKGQENEKLTELDGENSADSKDIAVKLDAPQPRKRSSASVWNEEPADGGRAKSRRIRARESIAEAQAQQDDIVFDQVKYFEDLLENFAHADRWMFNTTGALISKMGIEDLGTIDELKQVVDESYRQTSFQSTPCEKYLESVSVRDLREAIENWSGSINFRDDVFTTPDGLIGVKQYGLNVFLERSRQTQQASTPANEDYDSQGLSEFLLLVNSSRLRPEQAALKWLERHLASSHLFVKSPNSPHMLQLRSSYAGSKWSEEMRWLVQELLKNSDEFLYQNLSLVDLGFGKATSAPIKEDERAVDMAISYAEMAQTLYEVHLDMYASMSSPSNATNEASKALQKDRLQRWETVARDRLIHCMDANGDDSLSTSLVMRHIWSTIMHFNITEDASREYVVECLEDLKRILRQFDTPIITLVNNTLMSELSVDAIEQEIARISSMEFFMKVFGPGKEDPVSLIESIEPILDPSAIEYLPSQNMETAKFRDAALEVQRARDLSFFLDRGDATLKLLLWRRLQKAYDSIQYPTKVISCSLRSIEIIVKEFTSSSYLNLPGEQRRIALLRWLNRADYLMLNVIGKILDDPKSSFECIDMNHLQTSMSAVAKLSRLLHSFVLYEDSVRIGQTSPPEIRPAAAAKAHEHYKEKLRSMLVRAWTLQYTLLKEGIEQNREVFDTPSDDCINYLRSVHNALGIRSYCKYSNKLLLKVMKQELLTLDAEDNYESDTAQVLFDFYGLKFAPELGISLEHGCPVDKLDRSAALMMIDFAMVQANRMNIKDFLKSDLKSTIDNIQSAIGWSPRTSPSLNHNKRIVSAFLKSPINPSRLRRTIQGVNEVSVISTQTESYNLAERGWYFFLGHAALTKFKTQKRVSPGPSEDLDHAATFFRREIEHGIDRWQTWYRLGQAYDFKLEEDITWSAEKLNTSRADLEIMERRAINAYSMAIGAAIRTADSSTETKKTMSDLYTQFGFRIYASSRAPFSMAAFNLNDFMRHYNSDKDQRMYKGQPFGDMKLYSAWHFAGYLFRKAMIDRPSYWVNRYMFSKCLWKMFTSDDPLKKCYEPVHVNNVLDSLNNAINSLPQRKDNRSDPILEPHFKLVSIIHKLVKRGDLNPYEASEKLLATPWAKRLSVVTDMDSWTPFILEVLKNLRAADKSNWHHRVVARAAHVIYDDTKDYEAAVAAKHELSQHVFTKTMSLQVWKPENERPGRHFVYTSRYVYFFVHVLDQLNDRTGLDLLIRRVRRRPNDFVNFAQLWDDICNTYIKLFRRLGNIPINHEDAVFKPIGYEEFIANASRLDSWSHSEPADTATIDLVREAVELKKLNAGLMKAGIFEDLVGDTYALFYEKSVPTILEGLAKEENRERMKVDHLLLCGGTGDTAHTSSLTPEKPQEKLPEKAPKARAKGVTRREVQRKADAIAAKAAASRPTKASRAAEEDSKLPIVEQIVNEPSTKKDEIQENIQNQVSERTQEITETATARSAPPTVLENGDTESELSELDESKISELSRPVGQIFPHSLAKRLVSPNPQSEASSNISIDGGDKIYDLEEYDGGTGRDTAGGDVEIEANIEADTGAEGRDGDGLDGDDHTIDISGGTDIAGGGDGDVDIEVDEDEDDNADDPGFDADADVAADGGAGDGDEDDDDEGDDDADEGVDPNTGSCAKVDAGEDEDENDENDADDDTVSLESSKTELGNTQPPGPDADDDTVSLESSKTELGNTQPPYPDAEMENAT
ncbi:Histone transcription regulator 3 [Ophidiomyces ophidiicola]|nr:Histone transcription regulator 3 [Ophidiomyces ophidiicola]